MTTTALLDALRSEVEDVARRVGDGFSGLDTATLNWSPSPSSWSVGQCLDHLMIVNGLYLDRLKPALADIRRRGLVDPGTYRAGWFGQWFRRQMEPGRVKMKTPGVFRPTQGHVRGSIVEDFTDQQDAIRALLDGARGFDLASTKIASPVTRLIRFRVGDALGIVTTHQQRHVAQAERVAAHEAFPGRSA